MEYDLDLDQPELNGFAEDEHELLEAIDKVMEENPEIFKRLEKL